jgi:hypothetical protein
MNSTRDYRPAAYIFMLLGFALAFAAAFVPFFTAGYRLETTVLVILVAPFVIYGSLSESLRGPWLLGSGLVLLGICAVIVIRERFLHDDGNADDFIYWVPLLASVIMLPIAYMFGRRKVD